MPRPLPVPLRRAIWNRWQACVDARDRHQREGFPEPSRSRLRLFPGLAHSGRAYQVEDEATLGREDDLRRALAT